MKAQVYTLPHCPQCEEWKRYLTANGVEIQEISLQHPASQKIVRYMLDNGKVSAPLVRIMDEDGNQIEEFDGKMKTRDPLEKFIDNVWE